MNKKIVLTLISSLFLLAGCGGSKDPTEPSNPTPSGDTTPTQPGTPTPTEQSPSAQTETPTPTEQTPSKPLVVEDSFVIHYQRKNGNYENWDVWSWEKGEAGAAYSFDIIDDFGVACAIPLSTYKNVPPNEVGFLIRRGGDSWAEKDCGGSDIFVDLSLLQADENDSYHVYMLSGDNNVYLNKDLEILAVIKSAGFVKETSITAYTNFEALEGQLKADDEIIDTDVKIYPSRVEFKFKGDMKIDYTKDYRITLKVAEGQYLESNVSKAKLLDDKNIGALYNYDGELGAIYSKECTTFKVWSPLSKRIVLNVYPDGTPAELGGSDDKTSYEMVMDDKGVYSYTVEGDLEGLYYTYSVTNAYYKDREVCDPYAYSAGVNGIRGMIVDFDKTNPDGWNEVNPIAYDRKELVVYETHVADVTSSKTWTGHEENRKLFKGMYESDTTYSEGNVIVKTGFDHIKELGVNAVQIIPLFDQANDELNMTFNWGYNPLNYNVVEGGYSTNPKDGYVRIREFKELVQAYHEAGMNIIMDVVYNHVSSAQGSNFDVLMPEYYFRYSGNVLSNGSGCGNETACEHYMMRRFIIDSAKFWAKEYKLGGFRFDLMGLHSVDMMNELTAEVKAINPFAVIYGEPWTGGTSTSTYTGAKQTQGNNFVGYGAFNDIMRDALIKGGLNSPVQTGWITNETKAVTNEDMDAILAGIKGTTKSAPQIADPDKTVNYVTCHDNYTLYDRIIATGLYTDEDQETIKAMSRLANAVVMTSQGTSFMLAGEEFHRTKQGNNNSYQSSYEVNELDYSLLLNNPETMKYYQKLIALKTSVNGLHLGAEKANQMAVSANEEKSVINYKITDSANQIEYVIYHVNGLGTEDVYNLEGYELYLSTVDSNKILNDATELKPFETLIAFRSIA